MIKIIRTTIIVYGDVQKGDYRGRVVKIAKMMGKTNGIGNITGTVQNLENEHMVKIVAEGDSRDIDWFYDKIKIRENLINVIRGIRDKNKDIEIDENEREYDSFYKIIGEGETDKKLDQAAELLKDLAETMGNGFPFGKVHSDDEEDIGRKLDIRNGLLEMLVEGQKTLIGGQNDIKTGLNNLTTTISEHNTRLEAILEKLAEK